jgi:hypothetical protein
LYLIRREQLPLVDVTHHWRRFVEGSPTAEELCDLLVAGFWRGELLLRGGDGRALLACETSLEVLRHRVAGASDLGDLASGLTFWTGDEEAELGPRAHLRPDGTAAVDLRARI